MKATRSTENISATMEFFFLGFPGLGGFKFPVFIVILTSYTLTVLLDMLIILIASIKRSLHSPMYFFLGHFFFSEMLLMTLTVPNMLRVLWLDGASVSIPGCFAQSCLFEASGSSECYLLAAMSYDRYLAICKPLHYNSVMNLKLQYLLVTTCWMLGFLLPLFPLGFLVDMKFCEKNTIDHYFCDLAPIMDLACSDTSALQIYIFILSFPVLVIPFVLVIISYVSIFVVILRMSSITGRKKAFSTCSTHLSVVGMFFGTLIINYLIPAKEDTVVINKMISVIVIVVTPLFNPIIYSLRNEDMRSAIKSYVHQQK